jgi:hypothetical protein
MSRGEASETKEAAAFVAFAGSASVAQNILTFRKEISRIIS